MRTEPTTHNTERDRTYQVRSLLCVACYVAGDGIGSNRRTSFTSKPKTRKPINSAPRPAGTAQSHSQALVCACGYIAEIRMEGVLMMARATTAAGKLATKALAEPDRTFSEGMTCLKVLRPKHHSAMRLMVSNDHQRAYPGARPPESRHRGVNKSRCKPIRP